MQESSEAALLWGEVLAVCIAVLWVIVVGTGIQNIRFSLALRKSRKKGEQLAKGSIAHQRWLDEEYGVILKKWSLNRITGFGICLVALAIGGIYWWVFNS